MAVEYLPEGATSFASWLLGNGTAGSGIVDGFTGVINVAAGNITGAELDQSGLTEGFEYLKVGPQFTKNIGSESGAFTADFDSSSDAFFSYRAGGGKCYYNAGGDDNLCNAMDVGGAGIMVVQGGTVTVLTQDGGEVRVGASATITTARVGGGHLRLEESSNNATLVDVTGGSVQMERGSTTLTVRSGEVTIDIRDSDFTIGTLNVMASARVNILRSPNIATVNAYGGTINAQNAVAPMTLGSTAFNLYPGNFVLRKNANVQVTVSAGAYQGGRAGVGL